MVDNNKNQKPVKTYSLKNLSVSVFENKLKTDENKVNGSYKISKRYQKKDSEEWDYTDNLGNGDLANLSVLLQIVAEKELLRVFD